MNLRIAISLLAFGVSAGGSLSVSAQSVMITEFLASNGGGLRDENRDTSDWIELFNAGAYPVNMAGWSLTDDPARLTKWTFPPVAIGPHEFLLVWASGKNRRTPGQPLHTSFSLSAGGDYVALVRPGESIATEFAPEYPLQRANISYGFAMRGFEVLTNSPVYLSPTPREPNPGTNIYGP